MGTSRKGTSFRVAPDGASRGHRPGAALPPAGRARVDRGEALERLFESAALTYVAVAHEAAVRDGHPADPAIPSADALGYRIRRARKALRLGPGGASVLVEATKALAACEALLQAFAREVGRRGTFAEALPVIARFAILGASLIREERPSSTLEMSAAISCAFWACQAERDVAVLGATIPGLTARVGSSSSGPKGETVEREHRASYDERHRLAVASTTQSRQERLAFCDLLMRREKGRREGLGRGVDPELAARVERLIEAQGQRVLPAITVPAQVVDSSTADVAHVAPARTEPASAASGSTSPARANVAPPLPMPAAVTELTPEEAAIARVLQIFSVTEADGAAMGRQAEAIERLVGSWVAEDQAALNKWSVRGKRGQRPWRARTIPASIAWWVKRHADTAKWVERELFWTFERGDES